MILLNCACFSDWIMLRIVKLKVYLTYDSNSGFGFIWFLNVVVLLCYPLYYSFATLHLFFSRFR